MSRAHSDFDSLRAFVESVDGIPVLVRDRHLTVLASNALARALSPGFDIGVNLARYAFIDSSEHAGDECWHTATSQLAAMLRESLDTHREDAPFRRIVGELSARSTTFSATWAEEAAPLRHGVASFLDTPVGDLTLHYREEWLDDAQTEALILWGGVTPETETRLGALAALVGLTGDDDRSG